MTPERWQQVKEIFQSAIERPADERAAFIRSQCAGDETFATEVESLLAANDQAGYFIEALPTGDATVALEDLPIEKRPSKQGVAGSSPAGRTLFFNIPRPS